MPGTEPSDAEIAALVVPEMIEALMGYGQGDYAAREALVRILRPVVTAKPQPLVSAQDVLGRLGEVERETRDHEGRLRDIERRHEGGV